MAHLYLNSFIWYMKECSLHLRRIPPSTPASCSTMLTATELRWFVAELCTKCIPLDSSSSSACGRYSSMIRLQDGLGIPMVGRISWGSWTLRVGLQFTSYRAQPWRRSQSSTRSRNRIIRESFSKKLNPSSGNLERGSFGLSVKAGAYFAPS